MLFILSFMLHPFILHPLPLSEQGDIYREIVPHLIFPISYLLLFIALTGWPGVFTLSLQLPVHFFDSVKENPVNLA